MSSRRPEQIDKTFFMANWQKDQEDTEYDAADLPMQDLRDAGMGRTRNFESATHEDYNDAEDEDDEDEEDDEVSGDDRDDEKSGTRYNVSLHPSS